MDVLGVKQMRSKRQRKRSNKDIKVVYISSPIMVNTCASKFRALVQELTGKDSKVAMQIMDTNNGAQNSSKVPDRGLRGINDDHASGIPVVESNNESPTWLDSAFDTFDDVSVPQMEGSFMEMLSSNVVNESSHLDVFRSFGLV